MHQLNGELARAARVALVSGGDLRAAAAALRDDRAGGEPAIGRALDAIATRERLAAAVAADSYWHSNGFAKLNLHRGEAPAFRLRLHVWPGPTFDRPHVAGYENVHNHRWSFASVVLCGHLRISVFEETPIPDAKAEWCRKYAYETPGGAAFGELRHVGDAALRLDAEYDYGARDVHHCDDTSQLHAVAAHGDTFTATLVVQGPDEAGDQALVYQRTDRAPLEDTGIVLTADEVTTLARATLDAMHADGWR